MERAEIHDLSAAYALDALDADELEAFEEHLARCPECRENVASFQAASAELAYDTFAPAPPRALKERILTDAARERPKVIALSRPRRRWALPVAATAAVAAGCAAVGLAFWAADLSQQVDDLQAEQHQANEALIALIDPSASHFALEGADGVLVVDEENGEGKLVISGLESAPSDKTYAAWVIEGDAAPVPAGLFSGGDDQTVVPLSTPVPEGAIVAVTVEEAGGVPAPTQDPFILSEQTAA
ncbi:MAG: anti-sigma factor domain-containing protein [Gaiellaceae bacterium]